MKRNFGIEPSHLQLVKKILSKRLPANSQVWVFGSRAKQTAREYSDLDIAIDTDSKKLTLEMLATLAEDFEESDLPYKVDLVDLNTVDESFKTLIEKERVSVFLG